MIDDRHDTKASLLGKQDTVRLHLPVCLLTLKVGLASLMVSQLVSPTDMGTQSLDRACILQPRQLPLGWVSFAVLIVLYQALPHVV